MSASILNARPLTQAPQRFSCGVASAVIDGERITLPAFGQSSVYGSYRISTLPVGRPCYCFATQGEGQRSDAALILGEGDLLGSKQLDGKKVVLELPAIIYWFNIPRFVTRHLVTEKVKKLEYEMSQGDDKALCRDTRALFELGREKEIFASGVSVGKGGLRNLLGIALLGDVLPASGRGMGYWGGLTEGNAEYCAGPHGPYYVVKRDQELLFIVPNGRCIKALAGGLKELVEAGIIQKEQSESILSRTFSYRGFVDSHRAQTDNLFDSLNQLVFSWRDWI